jgi:6-phosphogluconolactonase (cycloisomerase 2 family)
MRIGAVKSLRLVGVLLTAAALLLVPSSALAKKHKKPKKVNYNALYSANNNPAGNAVVWFRRAANGTITQKGTVKTGGKGIASQQPFGFPIEDSSGSIALTSDGKLLFVPNAGDNTISAFQITAKGPKLVDRVTSGGILPVSMTVHKNMLYILNELSGTIFGYRFSSTGFLTPIVNSERALSTIGNLGVSAQIGFDPSGKTLVVSLRGLPAPKGTIDTFKVNGDGSTGPAVPITADDANPFGFAFAGERLIISNAGFVATGPGVMPNPADPTQFTGTTSSYNLSGTSLTLNNTAPSGGRAACWVVISKDKKFAFVVNTLSGTTVPQDIGTGHNSIARYSIGSDGKLTLLGDTDTTPGGFPGDESLSSDGKYLYVLTPFVMGKNTSHLDVYSVSGGNLTHVQATPSTLAVGQSGVGVH